MDAGAATRLGVRRTLGVSLSCLMLAALVSVAGASAAHADVFSNAATITIPDSGPGAPYPSPISVSGMTGSVSNVTVTLTAISHTWPDDIDVLLVGPSGQSVVLMSDTGDAQELVGVTLTFDDAATASLPEDSLIAAGTYKPTSGILCEEIVCGFDGTAPAPTGPYGTTLSVFDGTAPNGTWNLFVFDDEASDAGTIFGGWSLEITAGGPAGPTIDSFGPSGGPPGTSVTVTGTHLGGATAVTFGGVDAEFTPRSRTRVTATVPDAAVTGPIAVVTPRGTATSATAFTVGTGPVRHDREVALRVGNRAHGRVSVPDGFSACASSVPVKVQRREGGAWRSVGTTQTADGGSFVVPGTSDPGRYRALAKKVTLAAGDVCRKARSPVVSN